MIATVFVKTDEHILVDSSNLAGPPVSDSNPFKVRNSEYRDENLLGDPTKIDRTKVIYEPDAVAWYIVPGTVTDVTDGALVRSTGEWLRDDTQRIRTIAALAMAWYGLPRSIVEYEWGTISFQHPVGTMIRTIWGPEGITQVNTVVSRRSWSFDADNQTTSVETAFNKLDFSTSAPQAGRTGERSLRQEVRRLGRLAAKIPARPQK